MCGFIFYKDDNLTKIKIKKIRASLSAISHRGPNNEGFINHNNSILFGHRRLSIIDTSNSSHQPLVSDCSRYILLFNGEIYNYKELAKKII